ncbi:MAG: ABC transporter ATP-binding protein [Defluviitaleaceae bacterium]|nr:ABC transporter ATP-binding protein [Defluviitaleaceae bacterium]
MSEKLLEIRNMRTSFRAGGQYFAAVDNVSVDIYKNETLAVVGESGSGKSSMALSVTRLHNPAYTRVEGSILYQGKNLTSLPEAELNKVRGGHIGMIFQDPQSALNPLVKVGLQIEESLVYHTDMSRAERRNHALDLLRGVGMPRPELTYGQFPHELSGGMRQRAMIASALSCSPALVIADEPTTALDVTIQAQILDLMRSLQAATQTSILLITHDLGVVAEMADRVAVMYAGQLVELASCSEIFNNPLHPYTRSLLSSIPSLENSSERLHVIRGIVPSLKDLPRTGCRFSRRIPWMPPDSHQDEPELREAAPGHYVMCSCYETFELFQEMNTPCRC